MTGGWRDPLRWYPAGWRARYGDELRALIEDHSGDGGPGVRERLSLARHGLAERARETFLVRPGLPDESRRRGGALLVLVAWAVFMIGGAGFAKSAEHFAGALPAGSRTVPRVAFDTVFAGGMMGGAIVLLGAALAVPAFLRLLREGGWPSLRPHFLRAGAVTVVFVALTIPLAEWARTLSSYQRNGGELGYGVAFLAWGALAAGCLAAWTAVAVAVGRRADLGPRTVRREAGLAVALAVVMLVVTAAGAAWWAAMAASAPWFLAGTPRGTTASVFDLPLMVAMVVMVSGFVVSTAGAVRVVRR